MTDDQRVILEFTDGDAVEARLLWVDRTEHDDVGFDVIRIIRGDPNRYARLCVYTVPLDQVLRIDPVA